MTSRSKARMTGTSRSKARMTSWNKQELSQNDELEQAGVEPE
jgi:hypothetical protein